MEFTPYKTVPKPWGSEVWLALNEKYCFKRLNIHSGAKFSLQYHERKSETIVIHSGTARVTINDETRMLGASCVLDIPPGTVHRIEAMTPLVLYEASTPEVDDVVRLEDDYGRDNE